MRTPFYPACWSSSGPLSVGFDSCGCVFGVIRDPFRARFRFYVDDERETFIEWKRAKPGAALYTGLTSIHPFRWQFTSEPLGPGEVGELDDPPRNYKAAIGPSYAPGIAPDGTEEELSGRAPVPSNMLPDGTLPPEDVPSCGRGAAVAVGADSGGLYASVAVGAFIGSPNYGQVSAAIEVKAYCWLPQAESYRPGVAVQAVLSGGEAYGGTPSAALLLAGLTGEGTVAIGTLADGAGQLAAMAFGIGGATAFAPILANGGGVIVAGLAGQGTAAVATLADGSGQLAAMAFGIGGATAFAPILADGAGFVAASATGVGIAGVPVFVAGSGTVSASARGDGVAGVALLAFGADVLAVSVAGQGTAMAYEMTTADGFAVAAASVAGEATAAVATLAYGTAIVGGVVESGGSTGFT